jgi:hypothetical protein
MIFCTNWDKQKREVKGEISEDEAKKKHDMREKYYVVIREDDILKNVILFTGRDVIVYFYESELFLIYGFKIMEERLFLKTVYHYTYKDNELSEVVLFNFFEDGNLYMRKSKCIHNSHEEKKYIVDVSANWEKYPEFGCYSGILKQERNRR